ncbi:hypothetical protein V9K67_08360 [Paraflavisolibacter sp. H34]|uniref:hypothetical protein n=1 Tax=Huijunlia imazamoxiresistens TaxID=3127457 RepID=UPI003017E45B
MFLKVFSSPVTMRIAALAGLLGAFGIYFYYGAEAQPSSPLVLLLLATTGLFISRKKELGSSVFLSFAGASLLVHPFLFLSPAGYAVAAFPLLLAGVSGLVRWWNRS